MAPAILLAFGSAIVGAILGAYLQRRWTPDPSAEIVAVRHQIKDFQQRIETLEQERVESEHFELGMSLQQAVPGNYTMHVRNDSDQEVTVETINLKREDIELSNACRPKPTDDWKIAPGSGKKFDWAPQPDPVGTLQMKEPHLGSGVPIPLQLVLVCRVRGKPKVLRRTFLATVDFSNRQLTPYGP
jgi:hypothetical protein